MPDTRWDLSDLQAACCSRLCCWTTQSSANWCRYLAWRAKSRGRHYMGAASRGGRLRDTLATVVCVWNKDRAIVWQITRLVWSSRQIPIYTTLMEHNCSWFTVTGDGSSRCHPVWCEPEIIKQRYLCARSRQAPDNTTIASKSNWATFNSSVSPALALARIGC